MPATITPTISGTDTARRIREIDEDARIIFASVSREYAIEAYSIGAVHYIPKPVEPEALEEALDRAISFKHPKPERRIVLYMKNAIIQSVECNDILYIESILTPGKGKISLTGNLGDVMKESATIAREWVMAHYEELGIDKELFETTDLNIHVPEGAIPKDGPSAGITMITSIVSTYTGRKVRERIAMTGETTLRGRVMPIGGVKEKILAAKRAGIVEVLLPEENRKDVEEIKKEYLEGLTFHYVRTNNEVLELALEKR